MNLPAIRSQLERPEIEIRDCRTYVLPHIGTVFHLTFKHWPTRKWFDVRINGPTPEADTVAEAQGFITRILANIECTTPKR